MDEEVACPRCGALADPLPGGTFYTCPNPRCPQDTRFRPAPATPRCRFCEASHAPCTRDLCFCGNQERASVRRGEGYNEDCFTFWEGV